MVSVDKQGFFKVAVLTAVAGVLLTQTVASFGGMHRYRYWPFLSYPMYNHVHQRGEPIARYSLVAIFEDGSETPVSADDLKLTFWSYLRGPVAAARKNDVAGLMAHFQPFEHRRHRRVISVRLENHPVALVEGRVVPAPPVEKTVVLRPA